MSNQYISEIAGLWAQRDSEALNAMVTFDELVALDSKIDQRLGTLSKEGLVNWSDCDDCLNPDQPGSVFTAAVVAFEDGDALRIGKIVEVATSSRPAFRGAISALGWLNGESFRKIILDLVGSKSWQHRSLGIAACGLRRVNPRAYLNKAVDSSNLFLKIRAFKTAGLLKRDDLLPVLQDHFHDTDPSCRFEAARSALLLGDRSALTTLGNFILSKSKYLSPALEVALRVVDGQTALEWLKTLSRDPKYQREMLIGTAIVGNPAYVPILIKQMQIDNLARVAGDAFTLITGVDLEDNGLVGDPPESYLNTQIEINTKSELPADAHLAWPNAERVMAWWEDNQEQFPRRSRYLAGSAISAGYCKRLLRDGNQRIRHAASLELALGHVDTAYFNTRARAKWQSKRLYKK